MRRTIAILALGLVLTAAARAEEKLVTLKNGTKLTGEVENEAGPVVTVKTAKGAVRVPLNLIVKIQKVEAPKKPDAKPDPAKTPPPDKKTDTAKPANGQTTTTAPVAPIAPVASPSEGAHPLEARYAAVAALPVADRPRATLALAAQIPLEAQAEYLASSPPGPLSPPAHIAVDAFCDGGGPARDAALARLRAQNECGAALFAALERLWDKKHAVEDALIERLGQDCKDHVANITALAARGTRRSVPQLVDLLFFAPEASGLTFQAQVALREIAKRDASPDEALEPLVKNIQPRWPGPGELVRRRDVLLAMGGSAGAAVPYLEATLADLPADDVEPRGDCWLSLARIGTKEAGALLARSFREPRLGDQNHESRRVALLVEAIAEAATPSGRPEFLMAVADFHDAVGRPDQKRAILLALERASGQRFGGEPDAVRRLAKQTIEKKLAADTAEQQKEQQKQEQPPAKPEEEPKKPEEEPKKP